MLKAIRNYREPKSFEGTARLEDRTALTYGFGGPFYPTEIKAYALIVESPNETIEIPLLRTDHKNQTSKERAQNIDAIAQLAQDRELEIDGTFRKPSLIPGTFGPNEHYAGKIKVNGTQYRFDVNLQAPISEHVLSEVIQE